MDEEYIKKSDALACFYPVIDASYRKIEKMAAEDVVPMSELKQCRNELCLYCGRYKTRHLGSCDDCRWDGRMCDMANTDMINHPPHYCQSGIECIDAIKAIVEPCSTPYEAYLVGTILKYLWRFKIKNGKEDLKKAEWYLHRLIEEVDG